MNADILENTQATLNYCNYATVYTAKQEDINGNMFKFLTTRYQKQAAVEVWFHKIFISSKHINPNAIITHSHNKKDIYQP